MTAIQDILGLLVLIGVMILIHELGHFWAARYFDVKVDVFSFGFGPRLFGFKRGETDYRFSAILFGGYVKMAGEQPGDEQAEDPRSFQKKPRWQRLIIAFAGPFMNIVLAVVLLAGIYMVRYPKVVEPGGAVVGHVNSDSPAAKAGIQAGDKIVVFEGGDNPTWDDILRKEIASASRTLSVSVDRDGRRIDTHVTPVLDDRSGMGSAGWEERGEVQVAGVQPNMPARKAGVEKGDLLVSIDGVPVQSRYTLQEVIRKSNGAPVTLVVLRNAHSFTFSIKPTFSNIDGKARWMIGVDPELKLNVVNTRLSLGEALAESVRQNRKNATLIFSFLRGIVERRVSAKTLSGPIGIAQLSGEAARDGALPFLFLMTNVSLNLAIFNLLPIPILDGGMILLLIIEMLLGRDLSTALKESMLKVAFVFLMLVVVFVLYNDISKMLPQ